MPIWRILILIFGCRSTPSGGQVQDTPDGGISLLESLAERIALAEALLSEKEELARKAEREARFSECRAQVAEVTAEFALARAQCLEQLASEAQCKAQVEREKGDGTLAGCGVGILVALFSGGSATPWAFGGCLAGRALADAQARECGTSDCAQHLQERQQALLTGRGWSELPQCGGRLGIDVETPLITVETGGRVTTPGHLGSAGIQAGDTLLSMKGVPQFDLLVPTQELVPLSEQDYEAMASSLAGREVEFRYVRGEHLYAGRAMIPQDPQRGLPRMDFRVSASYRWGARVNWIAPWIDSRLGLEGATILTLDGRAVTSRDHLRDLLRYRRAGESVTLQLRSGGAPQVRDIRLTLGEREEPIAL